MIPFEYAACFMPPEQLATIIKWTESGLLTDGVAQRIFHLTYDIRKGWLWDVEYKEEDAYIWYVAGWLAYDTVPELPEEIRRIHNKQDIADFCKVVAQQEPKLYDLFLKGKRGPLIGRILKASCGRIDPVDMPEAF